MVFYLLVARIASSVNAASWPVFVHAGVHSDPYVYPSRTPVLGRFTNVDGRDLVRADAADAVAVSGGVGAVLWVSLAFPLLRAVPVADGAAGVGDVHEPIPIHAFNPGPMTGDGNWTWLIPDECRRSSTRARETRGHLDAMEQALAGARSGKCS